MCGQTSAPHRNVLTMAEGDIAWPIGRLVSEQAPQTVAKLPRVTHLVDDRPRAGPSAVTIPERSAPRLHLGRRPGLAAQE